MTQKILINVEIYTFIKKKKMNFVIYIYKKNLENFFEILNPKKLTNFINFYFNIF